jgi:LysR family transcriptional regulator, transcriptional activator of the cysJI operon
MDMEIRALRIFWQVMKDKSFSEAARSLKIAQPTVSQQIAKLEHDYGTRLFERIGHDIVPTKSARELFEFATGLLEQVDDHLERVSEDRKAPQGVVRYAMPETCQWTPHFRKIMSQIRELPDIRFEIDILPSQAIVEGLLESKYDFGFVVGEKLAPELRFEKFSDERYSCVAASKNLFEPFLARGCPKLISFPGWELFFTTWCKSHKLWCEMKTKLQEPAVKIGTLAGAIHAVTEGAGVAVLPTHCIDSELKNGALFEYRHSKGIEAANPIYLARRGGSKPFKRVELVMDMLRAAKLALG